MFLPAPLAGENVSRKARTVNALIRTLFLVYKQKGPSISISTERGLAKALKRKCNNICALIFFFTHEKCNQYKESALDI